MKRFDSLEGFRAVLAWWVVCGHIFGLTGLQRDELAPYWGLDTLRQGTIAVYIFMIFSGFVITHLMVHRHEPYLIFITRRFFRLWPVFAATAVVVALLHASGIALMRMDESDLWPQLALSLTMFHGLFPDSALAVVNPGWSISLEWQYYLIAPALLAAFIRPRWHSWLLVALLAAFAWSAGMDPIRNELTLFGTVYEYSKPSAIYLALPWFAIGMVSYWLMFNAKEAKPPLIAGIIAAILLGCLMRWWPIALAGGLWAMMLVVMMRPDSWLSKAASWKWLRRAGMVSYSTYIIHYPVLVAVRELILDGWIHRNNEWERAMWLTIIGVPLVAIGSVASYHLIEKPGIALGHKIARRMEGK